MTNIEIADYLTAINVMPCIEMNISNVDKVIDLSNDLTERLKKYQQVRKKIFEASEIKNDTDLLKHEKRDEIINQVNDLDQQEVTLDNANFLEKKELDKCIDKLPVNFKNVKFIKILRDLLQQKE